MIHVERVSRRSVALSRHIIRVIVLRERESGVRCRASDLVTRGDACSEQSSLVVAGPKCGHPSTRVHSRYRRTLADLPWQWLPARRDVRVRRSFCDVPDCQRRIFTERLRVIDLLPDREPDTLVGWLRAHRGVEFISRDRAGGYADAARRGAPDVIQIADRFHVVHNVTDAAQHALERHHADVRTIGHDAQIVVSVLAKRGSPVSRKGNTTSTDVPIVEQRKRVRRAR